MTPRRELPAMLAIAVLALLGWANGGLALVLVPVLAGAFVLVEAVARVRRWSAERRPRGSGPLDELTGVASRERLGQDVAAFLRDREDGEHLTLHVFDLVGFKKYNDAFGYAAGDALLRHLAARLAAAVGEHGTLYRLRGAQFGLTCTARGAEAHRLRARAAIALGEVGEGFLIEPAAGSATVPRQARSLSEALKLADQEVQAERGALRRRGIDETAIAPSGHAGGLTPSPYEVADLAVSVGTHLGLDRAELETVQAAAAWRDVGMMALPDEIVHATRPLAEPEWRFVRLHTLIGERLLRANFGLGEVAGVVRSSHERWDGGGYPDGLGGHDVPLGARIVFVCSAFQDMTAPRAHRAALSARDAIGELRRGSGSQFDPEVVAAFVHAFEDATEPPATGVGAGGGELV